MNELLDDLLWVAGSYNTTLHCFAGMWRRRGDLADQRESLLDLLHHYLMDKSYQLVTQMSGFLQDPTPEPRPSNYDEVLERAAELVPHETRRVTFQLIHYMCLLAEQGTYGDTPWTRAARSVDHAYELQRALETASDVH